MANGQGHGPRGRGALCSDPGSIMNPGAQVAPGKWWCQWVILSWGRQLEGPARAYKPHLGNPNPA